MRTVPDHRTDLPAGCPPGGGRAPSRAPERSVTIHWEIQREIARHRQDVTLRAAAFAPHFAGTHRRPMRRVASWARRIAHGLAGAVARQVPEPAPPWPAAAAGVLDLCVTVAPMEGYDGPEGFAAFTGRADGAWTAPGRAGGPDSGATGRDDGGWTAPGSDDGGRSRLGDAGQARSRARAASALVTSSRPSRRTRRSAGGTSARPR